MTTAKEKLQTLIIEDKQDSGLDADFSSTSTPDDDQQATQRRNSDDSGQAEDAKHFGLYVKRPESTGGHSVSSRYSRQTSESRASQRSWSQAWFKFSRKRPGSIGQASTSTIPPGMSLDHYQRSRLRDSLGDLAHELHTVDYLSSSLCQAFHQDISRAARCRSSVVYDQVRAKQDLAGSIVDSYDLDDASDTYSYVSTHLSNTNYPQPLRYTRGHIQDGEGNFGTLQRFPSAESVSTIGNDRYYPSEHQGRFTKRGRHSKRLGRRSGWKREPKPKIFTVFGPKTPKQAPVAKAGVKIIYDEGTYV